MELVWLAFSDGDEREIARLVGRERVGKKRREENEERGERERQRQTETESI